MGSIVDTNTCNKMKSFCFFKFMGANYDVRESAGNYYRFWISHIDYENYIIKT